MGVDVGRVRDCVVKLLNILERFLADLSALLREYGDVTALLADPVALVSTSLDLDPRARAKLLGIVELARHGLASALATVGEGLNPASLDSTVSFLREIRKLIDDVYTS